MAAKKKATRKVAKKKATRKKKTTSRSRGGARPGAGRPAGSTGVLPHGAVKGLKLMSGIPAEALEIPEVKKAVKTIMDVMQGDGLGRYTGFKVAAANAIIELYVGKPKARHEHDTGPTLAELLAKAGEKET